MAQPTRNLTFAEYSCNVNRFTCAVNDFLQNDVGFARLTRCAYDIIHFPDSNLIRYTLLQRAHDVSQFPSSFSIQIQPESVIFQESEENAISPDSLAAQSIYSIPSLRKGRVPTNTTVFNTQGPIDNEFKDYLISLRHILDSQFHVQFTPKWRIFRSINPMRERHRQFPRCASDPLDTPSMYPRHSTILIIISTDYPSTIRPMS